MTTAPSHDEVTVRFDGHVAHLRIRRPAKLNALTFDMVRALLACCVAIEHHAEARVVILSGEGKAFCAGGDIADWSDNSPTEFGRHWVRDGHTAFDALARLRQPVIAVLDGHVLGGGLELAACADYRIAEVQIKIGQPEAGLGIIPGWSGTQRAVRRFGAGNVRQMALFGSVFTAEDAHSRGLVDQVVETGQALGAADTLAAQVLKRGPRAIELTKMLINAAEGEERERVLESLAGSIAAASSELREGLDAFRNKRPPNFSTATEENE